MYKYVLLDSVIDFLPVIEIFSHHIQNCARQMELILSSDEKTHLL